MHLKLLSVFLCWDVTFDSRVLERHCRKESSILTSQSPITLLQSSVTVTSPVVKSSLLKLHVISVSSCLEKRVVKRYNHIFVPGILMTWLFCLLFLEEREC